MKDICYCCKKEKEGEVVTVSSIPKDTNIRFVCKDCLFPETKGNNNE